MRKNLLYTYSRYIVAVIVVISVLLTNMPAYATNRISQISDIADSSDYAMQSIHDMAQKGIISGDEHGCFYPHSEVTRAEAVKILVMALGLDIQISNTVPTFQDVLKDSWAYPYIETAYKAGIISGVAPGRFDPDGKCTREQLAKLFINSMELSNDTFVISDNISSSSVCFKDYDKISDWAKDAVKAAVYSGIMQGTGEAFLPEENATKEQMAVVADRFTKARIDIQEKLDAISNIQITGRQYGFTFVFSQPLEGLNIQSITDKNGVKKRGSLNLYYDNSTNYHKWTSIQGEHVKASYTYSPNPIYKDDGLITGETYHIKFSFNFKYGNTKTVYCEKDITILPNTPHVEAVIPLNINQIQVQFSDWVTNESADNKDNYFILDESGNKLAVQNIEDSGLKDATKEIILNLSQPITERAKLMVSVKNGIQRFSDSQVLMPYNYTVVLNDTKAPDIERNDWNNDGKSFTTVTLYFSEPVKSGIIMIDNTVAGIAKGESTTISGLHLDGSTSHQVSVADITDGVNQTESSVLTGIGRLYDPPKTETIPPSAEHIDFTRDKNGRVDSIIITYNEDLLPSIPCGGQIKAYDEEGNQIFAEEPVIDQNDKNIASDQLFCYTPVTPSIGRTLIFTIAEGVDIYNGRYTIVLPAYFVADTQYNDSLEQTLTVEF